MAAKPAPIPLSLFSLCALVVANMVGTGVFTSIGFQLVSIRSGFVLLGLWGLGGLCALCGALSYAELGTIYCRSGGEYTILSRIYGRPVGFLAGWVSVTAGFAAPVALAAMALGSYACRIQPRIHPVLLAQGAIVVLTILHVLLPRIGLLFQDGFEMEGDIYATTPEGHQRVSDIINLTGPFIHLEAEDGLHIVNLGFVSAILIVEEPRGSS